MKRVFEEVEIMWRVLTNISLLELDEEAGKWEMLSCADKVENFEYFYGRFRLLANNNNINNNKDIRNMHHIWTLSWSLEF